VTGAGDALQSSAGKQRELEHGSGATALDRKGHRQHPAVAFSLGDSGVFLPLWG
jgi:hypothetical protein